MSGTRKMDKFDADAFQKEREAELDLPARPFEPRNPDPPAPPPPATGDTRALEQVLASAAAEARRAGDALNHAHARLAQQPQSQSPSKEPSAPSTPSNATPADHFVPAEAMLPAEESAPGDTPSNPDALRTRLARKFVTLADSVTEAFKDFSIGAGAWSVELTVPQGMSTGGGKQALQHLRLNPRRPGHNVFVAGTVNQVEKRADLRDFDHVTIMHDVRHRSALEITATEWEQFLKKAEAILNGAGIQSMRTPPPRELLEQRRSSQRTSKGAVVALIVILLLASVVAWRVLIALRAGT